MSPSDPSTTRAWLEESAWVQRLARRLVSESAAAEDLAQEAMLVALRRGPTASVPLRSWLGGVVRNLARVARRGDTRRVARERAHAPEELVEGSEHLAERLELQERLVAAVRGLDEPYRTTVALRYLEDLTTQEVAARMQVPVKTVHTRLERALAQLRERLDRQHGSRAAWAGLLVPLPVPPPSAPFELAGPAAALPLVAMGTVAKWSIAAVALAALGLLALQTLTPDERRPLAAGPAQEPPANPALVPATAPEVSPPRAARETTAELDPTTPHAPAEAVLAAAPSFTGFVRDLDGRGLAGLTVTYERIAFRPGSTPAEELPPATESGVDGAFTLPVLSKEACRILARGHGLATCFAPSVVGTPPEPPVVYVGPERSYAGLVLDADGQPIAGAELDLDLDDELARELTPGSFSARLALARVTTDAAGRFAFPPIGFAPGSRVGASAEGYLAAHQPLPELSNTELLFTLAPSAAERARYEGVVLQADGQPAVGAYVACGARSARTDEDGRFALTPGEGTQPTRLRAILPGFLPAELELATLAPGAEQELVLVLGSAGLTIGGHVRDAEGAPVPGARVWTLDGEPFGEVDTRLGDITFSLNFTVEGVIDGPDDGQADGRSVRSASDGSFELSGLVARRYGLFVLHPATHELVGPLEVQAGEREVTLTLPGSEPPQRVAGRVTSLAGTPIVGATIVVAREGRAANGGRLEHRDDTDAPLRTDAEGRFEFAALCVAGTRLLVSQPERHAESSFALADYTDTEDLHFALPAVCYVRVTLDDPARATSLELQDARGRALDLVFQIGGVLCMTSGIQLDDGRSERITTDESATTLVLHKGAEIVERIPIRLVPGAVNELVF